MMTKSKNRLNYAVLILVMIGICGTLLCGCATKKETKNNNADYEAPKKLGEKLTWSGKMDLQYAKEFAVDYYMDPSQKEYCLISINQERRILVVDQDTKDFSDVGKDITIIKRPENIYLVASQVMDALVAIDALPLVHYSATKEADWYVPEAIEAMQSGQLIYAGKYSAPDYELLTSAGCDLAIENTMIYHSPQVRERLEGLGIPVIVDRSSYESEPLGRCEWVKLYGALMGTKEAAEEAFSEQEMLYENTKLEPLNEKPCVAFFYIAANGEVKVRKSADYLPKMIALAGGQYVFANLGEDEENASSTVTMQMEEFYATAKDADYLIYNSTVEGELQSVEDLIRKNELFRKFKAVEQGNVYCISKNLFQSTMEVGEIISDLHGMFLGKTDMKYLFRLQ